ncbi:hypothetical protein ABWH93_00630 [Seohaeicola saemankumensis]|uniref:hypothetical protein n=1 Tax=Seohaeicola saemankumensis TaxID=481181 RepID=UPI0007F3A300|nr:hypothetical protein [Paracoccaceae bacterium]OAN70409.1 hypothetical protein A8B83_12980 [Rhodobacteraceae bacterium EhC02]
MKYILLGAGLAMLPFAATAQVSLSGGAAVATSYDLTTDSNSEADYPLSFYLQAETNGFYGQLWFGTLPGGSAPDKVEMDVILGYGTELSSGLGIDLSYSAYFLDDSGYDEAEVIAAISYGLSDSLSGSLAVGYLVESEDSYIEAGVDYALTGDWSLQALLGTDSSDVIYYELGVTYAISDEVAFNILYEDDDTTGNDGLITFTMSYDFSLSGN